MVRDGLAALGDFDEVEAELGLDRAVDDVDGFVEDDLIELRDHLALAEFAEFAALLARRALRVLLGERGEVCAALDFLFELGAGGFVLDENVTGRCFDHAWTFVEARDREDGGSGVELILSRKIHRQGLVQVPGIGGSLTCRSGL